MNDKIYVSAAYPKSRIEKMLEGVSDKIEWVYEFGVHRCIAYYESPAAGHVPVGYVTLLSSGLNYVNLDAAIHFNGTVDEVEEMLFAQKQQKLEDIIETSRADVKCSWISDRVMLVENDESKVLLVLNHDGSIDVMNAATFKIENHYDDIKKFEEMEG